MERARLVPILVVLFLMGGCSGPPAGDSDWGREADAVVAELASAYDLADSYQTARFFSAGGSLDLSSIWGGLGVASTPDEVVKLIERVWFWREGVLASVAGDHLFLSSDGAIVWWLAYTGDGFQNWLQSYVFDELGGVASTAFRAREAPFEHIDPVKEALHGLAIEYIAAWAEGTLDAFESVYTDDVGIWDDLLGVSWQGLDQVAAQSAVAAPLELGPWPAVFVYGAGEQAIVLFQLGGECPMLEARRWVLDDSRIVRETRFAHVPSVRRCLAEQPTGWWESFEVPEQLKNNVTEVIDAGGSLVDLVNAEPAHEEFSRWLIATYAGSGLGLPEIAAIWYPPAPWCDRLGGLAIEADERYEGRHTVVVCFSEDRLRFDDSASGWNPSAVAYALHELAHIWMVDTLDDATRAAYNQHEGLTVWRGTETPWADRGVERAAFTIAWGLAGNEDARYSIAFPPRPCEHLRQGYEMLTGREPITTCGEGGWSQ